MKTTVYCGGRVKITLPEERVKTKEWDVVINDTVRIRCADHETAVSLCETLHDMKLNGKIKAIK